MGRKSKKKAKKISAKREKYLKFHKEKPTVIEIKIPDLTPEQQKQRQIDELAVARFMRMNKHAPRREIREKK